jgi:hypothetical protein
MTEKNELGSSIPSDRLLIIILSIVVGMLLWNSRSSLMPTQEGYARGSEDHIYCTFYGGSSSDQIRDVVLDSEGNMIIVGGTFSPDLPVKDAHQAKYSSEDIPEEQWFSEEAWFWLMGDGFVAKFSPGYELEWSTYIGGSDREIVNNVVLDSDDNILVFGRTLSDDFPVTDESSFSGNKNGDAFIIRFTPAGQAIDSRYYAGSERIYIKDVDKDPEGNIVLAGETTSRDYQCTENAAQSSLGGDADGFIRVLTEDLDALVYSTLIGGEAVDGIGDISVDADGHIYASGYTQSVDLPVTEDARFPDYRGGSRDGFILKMGADGQFELLTYLGGSDQDDVFGLATDVEGSEIVVVGRTRSVDFPVTGDEFQGEEIDLEVDGFLSTLSPDGELLRSTRFGLNDWDSLIQVDVDEEKRAIITGFVLSGGFETANAFQSDFRGDSDIIVIVRGDENELLSYLGGLSTEHPFGQCVSDGRIYLVGTTASQEFPVSNDAFQQDYGGCEDGILWIIDYEAYMAR